jgi:hypothetical protein
MNLSIPDPKAIEPAHLDGRYLELRGYSYDERRHILPAVTEVVSSGGCWLRERRILSFTQIEFYFEMQLRGALDLYSALIGAGLELTQPSHSELTGLCTVRRHDGRLRQHIGRVVSVRLEVSFLEDSEFDLSPGGVGLA